MYVYLTIYVRKMYNSLVGATHFFTQVHYIRGITAIGLYLTLALDN